jgi:hypothetical protein
MDTGRGKRTANSNRKAVCTWYFGAIGRTAGGVFGAWGPGAVRAWLQPTSAVSAIWPLGRVPGEQVILVALENDDGTPASVTPVAVRTDLGVVARDRGVQNWAPVAVDMTDQDGLASFRFSTSFERIPGLSPGLATLELTTPSVAAPVATATVTVVGPPAILVIAANPIRLTCGEVSTITATVRAPLDRTWPMRLPSNSLPTTVGHWHRPAPEPMGE